MRREIAVVGPVRADHAWERYAEIDGWPSWAPPIRSVDATARRIAAGVSGVVHGPAGVRILFLIDSVDEAARSWTWRVRLGPLRMRLIHSVRAGVEGGCVATLTVEGPAPLALLYPELAKVALQRLVH
ncbi:MAG: hypothetical protein QOF52_2899 [Propionibacteriaceae bacterium]|jgi:hypothetical protein|nr:hypothetical protein [Propionibacteriaceae bacterium]MDX6323041.1 hypothetical protein [Propionibacteriaceae bacterium]